MNMIVRSRPRFDPTAPDKDVELIRRAAAFLKHRVAPIVAAADSRAAWRFRRRLELFGSLKLHGKLGQIPKLPLTWNRRRAAVLVALAENGDADAAIVLSWAVEQFIRLKLPLPGGLGKYVSGVLNQAASPKKPGRNPRDNEIRNMWIAAAVARTAREGRLNATRNDSTQKESGCSIVAKALASLGFPIGESSVKGIFKNRKGEGGVKQ